MGGSMKRFTFTFNVVGYVVPVMSGDVEYRVVKKNNGKKVPYKVKYIWPSDGWPAYWVITCRTWAEMRHVQRVVFGWR